MNGAGDGLVVAQGPPPFAAGADFGHNRAVCGRVTHGLAKSRSNPVTQRNKEDSPWLLP
jgi:hypothetical protein